MVLLLKIIFTIVGVLALGFALFLAYMSFTDYKPPPETIIYKKNEVKALPASQEFKLMIWNIGYAGLSKDMDFFYDGGKKVRPSKETVIANLAAIERYITEQTDTDFIMLQEVDKDSKRSYSIDGYRQLAEAAGSYHSVFGHNYNVSFIPVPLKSPMGHVNSGLQTLSRFEPVSVVRHSFPGSYPWPQGLFMLDRCFLVSRYPIEKSDRQLLVINTHNSAYDDGSLRSGQMDYLKTFLQKEYQAGNYVVVGGDWNQCPPAFTPGFNADLMDNDDRMDIESDYLPDWQWVYDGKIPTNRRVLEPYNKETTKVTLIDFFLVSPNIEIVKVKGEWLDFEHSDHHPVKLEIRLKTGG